MIQANGGNGSTGGGGGGRVAIWEKVPNGYTDFLWKDATQTESLENYLGAAPTVAFGTATLSGHLGTILYLKGQPAATLMFIR